ncbi:Hypothetical_protein [Hexamita inflata]|uniref:Hypothetical_protein n=1 Tax=Hexamita inflata TaxID=28002 RepID=A0AA86NIE4_9EUKA|nr:Hypothetical protein HINF_LOCUS7191 [Hexamita inflata]
MSEHIQSLTQTKSNISEQQNYELLSKNLQKQNVLYQNINQGSIQIIKTESNANCDQNQCQTQKSPKQQLTLESFASSLNQGLNIILTQQLSRTSEQIYESIKLLSINQMEQLWEIVGNIFTLLPKFVKYYFQHTYLAHHSNQSQNSQDNSKIYQPTAQNIEQQTLAVETTNARNNQLDESDKVNNFYYQFLKSVKMQKIMTFIKKSIDQVRTCLNRQNIDTTNCRTLEIMQIVQNFNIQMADIFWKELSLLQQTTIEQAKRIFEKLKQQYDQQYDLNNNIIKQTQFAQRQNQIQDNILLTNSQQQSNRELYLNELRNSKYFLNFKSKVSICVQDLINQEFHVRKDINRQQLQKEISSKNPPDSRNQQQKCPAVTLQRGPFKQNYNQLTQEIFTQALNTGLNIISNNQQKEQRTQKQICQFITDLERNQVQQLWDIVSNQLNMQQHLVKTYYQNKYSPDYILKFYLHSKSSQKIKTKPQIQQQTIVNPKEHVTSQPLLSNTALQIPKQHNQLSNPKLSAEKQNAQKQVSAEEVSQNDNQLHVEDQYQYQTGVQSPELEKAAEVQNNTIQRHNEMQDPLSVKVEQTNQIPQTHCNEPEQQIQLEINLSHHSQSPEKQPEPAIHIPTTQPSPSKNSVQTQAKFSQGLKYAILTLFSKDLEDKTDQQLIAFLNKNLNSQTVQKFWSIVELHSGNGSEYYQRQFMRCMHVPITQELKQQTITYLQSLNKLDQTEKQTMQLAKQIRKVVFKEQDVFLYDIIQIMLDNQSKYQVRKAAE